MSIFTKIKQMLGIGTVSVKLNVPGSVTVAEAKLKGSMLLTAKSDQNIKSIEVKLEEEITTGRGDDKKTKTYTIGTWRDNNVFDMTTGDTKTIDFEMPFEINKTGFDDMAQKGGVLGGIGKLAKFADNSRSEYKVIATVDVTSAKLDPNDVVSINITK